MNPFRYGNWRSYNLTHVRKVAVAMLTLCLVWGAVWLGWRRVVRWSCLSWYGVLLLTYSSGVNHLITIDCVKGIMHDNMFNVLYILSTVTHMSVNKTKLVKMCIKLIMPCLGPNESGFMIVWICIFMIPNNISAI